MPYCGPVCAVPSCESIPVVGFGSGGSGCYGSRGYGSYGSGYGCGSGSPYGSRGGSISSASLGVLPGVKPSCISQLPPQECVIKSSPVIVTIPGAILSSSCDPLLIGGNSPCAVEGVGICGLGSGQHSGYLSSRRGSLCGTGIVCNPCQ